MSDDPTHLADPTQERPPPAPEPPPATHRARERRGFWVSAVVSAGLFTAPWLMALSVGVYADFEPATDLAIELYEPIEAVYLTLDPPPTEEPDFPEPVEELDEADEEVPPDEVGEPDGEPEQPDAVDEQVEGEPDAETSGDGADGADEGDAAAEVTDDDGEQQLARKVGGGERAGQGSDRVSKYARKGRRAACSEPHPNVREGADGIMEIDRSLVDYYTESLGRFMELGYSEPFNKEGTKGFYIGGFGCRSPVYKAGLRRGDVLLRVNGQKTRTWVGVFFLYKKLKNKDHFEVELIRKGSDTPQTLHFRVVDS
jgi:hypothetical protein